MKNRILCNLFLYYQDFLHHSVKIGSDVFIYNTPHTSFSCLKIKPPLSNPHHIATLMHTVNNANKLLLTKFCVWLHDCHNLYPRNTICEDLRLLGCVRVLMGKQFLTFWRVYSPSDAVSHSIRLQPLSALLWDLSSRTTQSILTVLFNDIKQQVLSIH